MSDHPTSGHPLNPGDPTNPPGSSHPSSLPEPGPTDPRPASSPDLAPTALPGSAAPSGPSPAPATSPDNSSNPSSALEPDPAASSGSGPSSPLSFMLEAIRLAAAGISANSGGPFGCVIVKDGKIIGKGNNQVIAGLDPTAHAEIVAIREACQHLQSFQLTDCELYTTCEPCPMCMGAIYWARPRIVYFANTREDAARIGFDDSLIYRELALPAENRKIPLIPLGRTEALPLFSQWQDKADKTTY